MAVSYQLELGLHDCTWLRRGTLPDMKTLAGVSCGGSDGAKSSHILILSNVRGGRCALSMQAAEACFIVHVYLYNH